MRKQKSKITTTILVAALAGVLVIGGTLAFLSAKTAEKVNNFTFKGNISATLTEPTWDAGVAADASYGKNLTPGAVIAKDPIVTNTCDVDEYVAIKVTFQKGDGTTLTSEEYTKLMTMIDVDWSTDWTLDGTAAATSIYDYNTVLTGQAAAPYSATSSLFTNVTIHSDLSNEDITWLNETLGGFNIVVQGAAIQGNEFDTMSDAKAELNGLFE